MKNLLQVSSELKQDVKNKWNDFEQVFSMGTAIQ